MFDNNYLKTKLKFHYKKVTITSHSKVYENGSECIELFVFKSSKNCYPQTFLQKFKWNMKNNKLNLSITKDLEGSSSGDSEEEDFVKILSSL